jgi:tetratricopeptide (TPR) repeat protein
MALGFGFNKVKVLASAEKFVQQGKLQNAIAEYEKVAREDPKDLTVLNTIGDLYARIGDNEHAVHYFKKVGDQYAQSGFTVKAIAIYKKLSKLATSNAEHITKLAELYTQQGLFTDARAQYMLMADAHLRAGETNQAARIFQKILELDPENAAMQAKLADLYMKLGKKEDALKIYSSAAEALYARGSMEAAAEALNKVITLDPSNAGGLLLRGMIAADSGDHVSAIQYLELVPDLNSRPDTLRALLRARIESDNIEGADALAQTLLDRHNDPSALSNLAEWYVNHDHVSSAVRLYECNGNKLFGDNNAELQNTLYALINKVKDNPEALDSLQKLLQQRGGDAGTSAEVMELQAHAAAQKGDYAQARDLYKKLSELEPENALHSQNHRQMLVKLGEDSATRILTPEEAAQAFMVEELDENAVVVHQKYDTPTETAIEAALTDAELYVSYNVPSKAIAPLEAALPLAPKDITLNQRLATLYARAERYGDASKICKNLSDIYHELGHTAEAAKYQEASRKYGLRAGVAPSAAAAMRNLAPLPARAAEAPAQNITAPMTPPAAIAPGEDTASSVQEFSFDVAMAAEPEATAAPPEIEILPETPPVPPEFELQAYPVKVQPEPVQEKTPEVAESNEWEDMLSVEVDEPEEAKVELADEVVVEDGTKLEPELIPQAMVEPEPMVVAEKEPEGGSSVCYAVDDKVQEVQFFISQKMWKAANDALNELSEIAPDSARIPELMAAIAAEQSRPAPEEPAQPAASAALEEAAASFLPPPFAAPAPQTNLSMADPFAAHIPASHATPAAKAPAVPPPPAPKPAIVHAEDPVLELDEEIATPAAKPARVSPAALEPVASAKSTEDILTDFVHDLESDELKDFLPRPHAERAMPAQVAKAAPQPVAAPVASRAHTNGGAQAEDASSVLADMLSDLQDETAEAAEPQEDPETHYNLGIAFKEMGLLDEAIGELQKVCHAIDSGHTFSQPIQAYTWLAQCLVDKGAPEAAVRWYQKALKIPELDDSSRCAIYYDLAAAYEAFGDRKSALTNFMEVYGSNIDFRDVASRIKTLKS